jgi:hypothetical protein
LQANLILLICKLPAKTNSNSTFNQAAIIISTISTETQIIRALSKEVITRIIKLIVIPGEDFTIEVVITSSEVAKTKTIKAGE